ncbi:MAG: hypothetical protein U0939_22810 [Pirellulales bacterium]
MKREDEVEELLKLLRERCDALEKVTVKLQQQLFEHVTVQHTPPKQSELNFGW